MAGGTVFRVTAKKDFLTRLSAAQPLMALAECIWNSLDADAMKVEVEFLAGPLGLEKVVIRDDGTGMTRDDAPKLFEGLGGSWKTRAAKTRRHGRFLHGREGRGRFKAFTLGRVADWNVIYDNGGALRTFRVSVISDDLERGEVSDEDDCSAGGTGVELVISELTRDLRHLAGEDGQQALTEVLAPYLLLYPDVRVSVNGLLLNPEGGIANRKSYPLAPVENEGVSHPVMLEVIEWKRATDRSLYLCGAQGFPLLVIDERLPQADRGYCAYLKSPYLQDLHDKNVLGLGELNSPLQTMLAEARQAIRDHMRRRAAAEAQSVVQAWKNENVYPYAEAPLNAVEQVERDVFDIVAVTAARHIEDFDRASQKARRLQLRTLRIAVEQGGEEIQFVLGEVLKLPKKELGDLAGLLRETTLSSIIAGARVVSDRLRVITGLESLVFEKSHSRVLKERSQLHRLVAENTWLFGEENNLMVDDEGLDRCLAEHAKARGVEVLGSAPVLHPTKKRGIVDLMFGRQRRPHGDGAIEHLVVELKAPKVCIRQKEIGQVEGYAQAVVSDARFDKARTKWTFWVLSRTVDEAYCDLRQIRHAPTGVINESGNVVIWVKTWSSLFQENRARLKFFQEALAVRVTREGALDHLRQTYSKYLENVLSPPVSEEGSSDEEDEQAIEDIEAED